MWGILLLLLLINVCCVTCGRPHIVLIVADDLGWDDVGFHGSEINTPNIDRLAKEGIILNNYYVSPICTPTRGALMTGRNPISLGLQHGVIAAPQPYGLPLNHTTMAEYLKHLNYSTHIVGKWHLGYFAKEYTPTFRGFDSHFGYWNGHEDYFDHMAQDPWWGLDFRENLDLVKNKREKYSTELFTSRAEDIIMRHDQSKPLFLYLAHQAVHAGNYYGDPLQAPQKYVNKYRYIKDVRRRIFAGMVAALDESMQSVTNALTQANMINNTIIVFTTDNGGPANGYDRNAACNWPLRGTKNTLWEGGIRGTSFIHSALLKKSGYISNHLLHVTDWLPTLYHAAGGNVSDLKDIDGFNVWDSLSTNSESSRIEVLHNMDPIMKKVALRVGDYKLIIGDISGGYYDGWYPPPGLKEGMYQNELSSDEELVFQNFSVWFEDTELLELHGRNVIKKTGNDFQQSMMDFLSRTQEKFLTKTKEKRNIDYHGATQYDSGLRYVGKNHFTVKCGNRPLNYTTNCEPKTSPCLFNIKVDPCELNNIADLRPDIVQKFFERLFYYLQKSVTPANKPSDPKANPILHGNAWDSWIQL